MNKIDKSKLRPFNLDEALAGASVYTVYGELVEHWHFFSDTENPQPIVTDINDEYHFYDIEGKGHYGDLRLGPKRGWVVMGKNGEEYQSIVCTDEANLIPYINEANKYAIIEVELPG